MRILGISALYHDSAAALVEDGKIVAAAQEERFSRKKHDAEVPKQAAAYCLSEAGMKLHDLDFLVFYEKPLLKFERLLGTYLSTAPAGFRSFALAMPLWIKEKLFQRRLLSRALNGLGDRFDWGRRLLFAEHHQSHAASAFFASPFRDAAILTIDGVGEWATTTIGAGTDNSITMLREIRFPDSLGLLYSAFTYYSGFSVNDGEYKVMGLAPYGQPKYKQRILDHLIDVKSDGSFHLNQSYFDYCSGLRMVGSQFERLFDGPRREPADALTERHMDVAASVQEVLNDIVLSLARHAAKETGSRNLCMAGGVALNCVANGKLARSGIFDRIWIQPASGDAGGALGAALAAYYMDQNQPRPVGEADSMQGALLGPSFTVQEIREHLRRVGAVYRGFDDEACLHGACVDMLTEGKALGWFQGRMEFGPRALGNRSILADPRSPVMQATLNQKIKHRESFRPFAPSVLREYASEWFELEGESPYMLLTADVAPSRRISLSAGEESVAGLEKLNVLRSEIPAVTHVDYSARVQTVDEKTNPSYYRLIRAFHDRTGCPVLLNTSFNVAEEPVVCTPEDAFRCFMNTGLDALAIGNCFLMKNEQISTR